ncbi:MAG TPA: asparagine synthase (glutamine-hydrolyzing) [Burkholderiales bacterium]|nr:asparagine synthase (glutamine-hydrolyzing) [Burkholderiales bacterium]
MCGIVGKISLCAARVDTADVERMASAISHRGPDDAGVYVSPDRKVAFGHRRLAVIDLSPLGHQPMRYLDRFEVVFNGEIYNFGEKRRHLEGKGYRFESHSDTEVLLALYAEYGARCVEHLRGMFAFAIFDEREQTLFCARDRAGKKPFKYYMDERVFLFASELKAILTQPEYSPEPDETAIHHYLTLQYCPAPLTGFKGIHKLGAGRSLTLNLRTRLCSVERYWKLDQSRKLNLSEEEWRERILTTLDEATRLRMISDVPIGAFLSGGIDSSAVVAMMSRHSEIPVRTFSIGFAHQEYNELPFARRIAEQFGTAHTEFIVEPRAIEVLPALVHQYEEPYADSSALPTYYLAKLTREHVTVALNGDGGDENFAGYGRYSAFKLSLALERLGWLHRKLAAPLTHTASRLVRTTLLDRAHRFANSLAEDYRKRYTEYTSYFTNAQKAELYTPAFKTRVWGNDTYDLIASCFSESGAADRAEQALYADICGYLPDDLLVKVDIATMSVALEARSPLLDHVFMELAATIPFHRKLHGLNDKKHVFKAALRGILPDDNLDRKKMGFEVPIKHWLRHELMEMTRSTLLNGQLARRGYFRADYMRHLIDTHCNTGLNLAPQIWALLTLELWFQQYFQAH